MDLFDSPSNLLMLGKTCNIMGFMGIREQMEERYRTDLRLQSFLPATPNLEPKLPNSKALPHPYATLLLSRLWPSSCPRAPLLLCQDRIFCSETQGTTEHYYPFLLLNPPNNPKNRCQNQPAEILAIPTTTVKATIYRGLIMCQAI